MKGKLARDKHGAAFTCADVDEGVVLDGMGRISGAPEVDEGAQDAGSDAIVGGDVGIVGMTGDEIASSDETAGFDTVDLVEGVLWRRHDLGDFGFTGGHRRLADLDEVGIAVEPEGSAACGCDALRRPCGLLEQSNGSVAYGLETGKAIDNLGLELRVSGLVTAGGSESDLDFVSLGDARDIGAGSFVVRGNGDGTDQAEIDDVAGKDGIVAVAESEKDVGFAEHLSMIRAIHPYSRQMCARSLIQRLYGWTEACRRVEDRICRYLGWLVCQALVLAFDKVLGEGF
jgi:hypothetical protein